MEASTSSTFLGQRRYTAAEHVKHAAAWAEQVRRYRAGEADALSPIFTGLGVIRKMGRAGDAAGYFPRLAAQLEPLEFVLADQRRITPAERWALEQAHTAVAETNSHTARRIGQRVYVISGGDGRELPLDARLPISEFDPIQQSELLITYPLQGGIR
ncbi:MAG TPA: hypothetical protein PKA05_18680 [Roseiflexaceae bacterium]|nr:hypothetical protein [Roseiflexaceae bacterium]HMP42411.1 hypothetical protein [Roseiflexaceae bacterium]